MATAIAASSSKRDTAEAILDVADQLRSQGIGHDHPCDAALAFVSRHHATSPAALSRALSDVLMGAPFIGWTGRSAFCGLSVPEDSPGLVVLALRGVDGYVRAAGQQGLGAHVAAALSADAPLGRLRLLSASPANLDTRDLLRALSDNAPPLVGALCVAPAGSEGSAIAPGVDDQGSAALMSMGRCSALVAVAQGARPLGRARTLTRVRGAALLELDGRPALEALLADLPPPLRDRLQELGGRLLLGISDADQDTWRMRHVTGIDPALGAVAIAGDPEPGAHVVYAMRDGEAARADIEETLQSLAASLDGKTPLAVLVFSCVGRDANSLGTPLYDVGRALDLLGGGGVPVVGSSSAGEIATLGNVAELFAYTAVVVALLPDDDA